MHANHNTRAGTPTTTPPPPAPVSTTRTTIATKQSSLKKEGSKGQPTRCVEVKGEEVLKEEKRAFSKNVRVNMESNNGLINVGGGGFSNNSVLNQHAKAAFKMPVTDVWGVAGSTQVKIRTSHTVRIILGILTLFICTGLILNYRIQSLEEKNLALQSQLTNMQNRLLMLDDTVTRLQEKQNIPITNDLTHNNNMTEERERSSLADGDDEIEFGDDDSNEDASEDEEPDMTSLNSEMLEKLKRKRRSVLSSSNSIETERWNGTGITSPAFNNAPVTLGPYGSRQHLAHGASRKRGNRNKRNDINDNLRLSQLEVSSLRRQRTKNKHNIAKLKLKLENARIRFKSSSAFAKNLIKTSTFSAPRNEPRAAYLTVKDPTISIDHPKQLIGPWYIAESGEEIGFNDMWYENLSLDDNGTSVIFKEKGLHLIYAQVFYKSVVKLNEKPAPMGFRIYLKKNSGAQKQLFLRPIPIAECVPSYPSTFFQTCFTQICWFVEQGDEIYLEHFTDAKPMIEAEKMGQTFLGIVRLSP